MVEGLKILESHLSAEEAKIRLRQAFIRKAFAQAPLFALPYDEADINWKTGSVKIARKRDGFCPTFSRAEFSAYFFESVPRTASRREGGMANDEISEAGRRARFEQWEKYGADRLKSDLQIDPYRRVGSKPVQDLAWEFVRMKDAEQVTAPVVEKTRPMMNELTGRS